jgi:hypothetical protein
MAMSKLGFETVLTPCLSRSGACATTDVPWQLAALRAHSSDGRLPMAMTLGSVREVIIHGALIRWYSTKVTLVDSVTWAGRPRGCPGVRFRTSGAIYASRHAVGSAGLRACECRPLLRARSSATVAWTVAKSTFLCFSKRPGFRHRRLVSLADRHARDGVRKIHGRRVRRGALASARRVNAASGARRALHPLTAHRWRTSG